MCIYRDNKVDEARFYGGYVLRGVDEDDLILDLPRFYGIRLQVSQDDVDLAMVYVPIQHAFMLHDDLENQAWYCYDLVLAEPEYNLLYQISGSYVQKQQMVSRDLICKWYYEHKFSVSPRYYDLMRVPLSTIGPMTKDSCFRQITWQSALIQPGLLITVSVKESDILYVPDYGCVDGEFYAETGALADYVNVNLSEEMYPVSYKSKETGWRRKTEFVSKFMLIQDYMVSVRAKLANMPIDEWLAHVNHLNIQRLV